VNIVYAKSDSSVGLNGLIFRLRTGEAWDADDPLVKQHPECFQDHPPFARTSQGIERVEQATAAPGEKRKSGR
jgi:hypothetical protein